ncbi:MAG: hypothetical protein U0T73_10140 [Chitinophagales bacterium]
MKKIVLLLALCGILTETQAQAFDRGTKLLTLGLGGTNTFEFDPNYASHHYGTYYYPSYYSRLSGVINVQMEFAVHKYVGVGFTAGFGGNAGTGLGSLYYYSYYNSDPQLVVPIGALANFHFYQLIADKTGKGDRMHSDKLDIYAGLNIGSGFAVDFDKYNYYGGTRVLPILFVGPQVGARYYFKPNIAVNAEFGYGKTFVNAGITFKMGGNGSTAEVQRTSRVEPSKPANPKVESNAKSAGNGNSGSAGGSKKNANEPNPSNSKPNPNGSKVTVTPAKK